MTDKEKQQEVGEKIIDLLFASDLEIIEVLETLDMVTASIELAALDMIKEALK